MINMKFTFFLLFLLAVFAAAQGTMPECAVGCATVGLNENLSCADGDYHCVCSTQSFIRGIAACINENCSAQELSAAVTYSIEFCRSTGVDMPEDVLSSAIAAATSKAESVTSTAATSTAVETGAATTTETSAAGRGAVDGYVAAAAGILAWGIV